MDCGKVFPSEQDPPATASVLFAARTQLARPSHGQQRLSCQKRLSSIRRIRIPAASCCCCAQMQPGSHRPRMHRTIRRTSHRVMCGYRLMGVQWIRRRNVMWNWLPPRLLPSSKIRTETRVLLVPEYCLGHWQALVPSHNERPQIQKALTAMKEWPLDLLLHHPIGDSAFQRPLPQYR